MISLSAIQTLIERWKLEDVVLLPPSEESVVRAKLDTLGRQYSRDVVALYCATGGMEDCDSHMWSLWSLERVIAENARYGRPYILFADFLIDSHCYCFRYENEESSSVAIEYFTGAEPETVAESVTEFFEIFIRDAAQLCMFE